MAKLVKIILLLLFTVLLYDGAIDSSTSPAEDLKHAITTAPVTQHCFLKSSDLPYLPEAELFGGCTPVHQLTMSRLQRIQVVEYSVFLKEFLRSMANREGALSLHQEKIYDTTTSYYCHPASQYYVFALRRIII